MSQYDELNELLKHAVITRYSSAVKLKDGSWIMGSYYDQKHVWFEPDMETVRLEIHHEDLMLNQKTDKRKEFERLLGEVE